MVFELASNAHFYGLYFEARKFVIKTKVVFRMAQPGENNPAILYVTSNATDATNATSKEEKILVRKIQDRFPELDDFQIDRSYFLGLPEYVVVLSRSRGGFVVLDDTFWEKNKHE